MTAVQTGRRTAGGHREGSAIRRATLLSGVLIAGGTALGFLRDLVMAHRFGASSGTDAFLVAWTIPETVSPLLIEDAMALLMVPLATRMLREPEGIRPLVTTVLPRLVTALSAAAIVLILAAPVLVDLLAPGLDDPGPATRCVRLTALTVLAFGVAGFMSATLRAHHRFGPPASIYAAYNAGILAMIAAFAAPLGITSAALGVACGGLLMILVQLPAFVRCVRAPSPAASPAAGIAVRSEIAVRDDAAATTLAAAVPIVLYTLTRQSQVLIERFLGSALSAGSISHLNYAQKVGQVPMVASLLLVTVTFPRLARATAGGDVAEVRRRVETDLVVVSAIVLYATACLAAFAPLIVELLFEHGRFTGDDTDRTATVLRVYVAGLWGQSMMGVAARAFFAGGRPFWTPVKAMAAGLAVTGIAGSTLVAAAGTTALAAANAAGITVAALLLLAAMRRKVAPVSLRAVGGDLATLVLAAGLAGAAGLAVTGLLGSGPPDPGSLTTGSLTTGSLTTGLLTTGLLGAGPGPLPRLLAGLAAVTAVYAAVLVLAAYGRKRATGPLGPLTLIRHQRHQKEPTT